jgi:Polyketide cyclase / dehydrase and lipid transport
MQVRFRVSAEEAFDYTVDPRNRPEWQSSLSEVQVDDDGPPRVGQTWTDVTKAGVRPLMRVVAYDRPHRWVEAGTWRGIEAELAVTFTPTVEGCMAGVAVTVRGHGVWRAVAPLVQAVSGLAIGPDLRRAAKLLERR